MVWLRSDSLRNVFDEDSDVVLRGIQLQKLSRETREVVFKFT